MDFLDSKDLSILKILQRDAKATIKQIAQELGISNSSVANHINWLTRNKFITGSLTLVDHTKLVSLMAVFILVKLRSHHLDVLTEFQQEIVLFPEVKECYQMTGEWDFTVKLVIFHTEDHDNFIFRLETLKDVAEHKSFFTLKEIKRDLTYPLAIPDSIVRANH